MSDIHVHREGSIFLVTPETSAGADWLNEHIADDAQTWGGSIVVEHRYVGDIVRGAIEDGLVVR